MMKLALMRTAPAQEEQENQKIVILIRKEKEKGASQKHFIFCNSKYA